MGRNVTRSARLALGVSALACAAILAPGLADKKEDERPKPARKMELPTGSHKKFQRLKELSARSKLRVFTIPVTSEIGDGMAALVRRGARRAAEMQADVVILEIDTPGGKVDSCQVINKELDAISEKSLTVAYVTHRAWSGGAMLALGCEFIAMRERGSIGGAKPILAVPVKMDEGMEEKIVSMLRADFKAMAEKNGHPPAAAMAMVDRNLEIHEVTVDGQRQYFTKDELAAKREADLPAGRVVKPKGQLLTLVAKDAYHWGLASAVVESPELLFEKWGLDVKERQSIALSWSERFVDWFSFSWLSMLLVVIGGLAILKEVWFPGTGISGLIGLGIIGCVLAAKYMAGLAEIAEILLILVGVALLVVEVFVIPGTMWAGIAGVICIALGMLLAFQNFVIPQNAYQVDVMFDNLFVLSVSFGVAVIAFMAFAPRLANAPFFRRVTLQATQRPEEGYAVAAAPELAGLKGMLGKAISALRPAGKAEVEGKVLDVVCDGEMIEPGAAVIVTSVEGMRIVVERAGGAGEGRA